MASAGGLFVDLAVNSAAFERDMGRASRAVTSNSARMNRGLAVVDRGFARTQRNMGSFLRRATSMRAIVGTLAGSAGLGLLVKRSLDAADAIAKTADKVGLTTDQLQELRFAADQSGVEQNNLDMAMQRFSRRLGEVAQGQGELLGVAEQYNIALRDGDGQMRSNIDLLGDFADVIANAESEQEALRIAFKLFDSEGAALVNLLRRGGAEMDALRRKAHELDLVIDGGLLDSASAAKDKLSILGQVIRTQATVAVAEHADEIGELADELIELTPEIIAAATAFAVLATDIAKVVAVAGSAVTVFGDEQGTGGFLADLARDLADALTGGGFNFAGRFDEHPLVSLRASLEQDVPEIVAWLNAVEDKFVDLVKTLGETADETALRRLGLPDFGAFGDGFDFGSSPAAVAAVAAGSSGAALTKAAQGRIAALEFERAQLGRTAEAQRFYNELKAAGVAADSAAGQQIQAVVTALMAEEQAVRFSKIAYEEAFAAKDELFARGRAVIEAARTPLEQYNNRVAELSELLEAGAIDMETFGRATATANEELEQAEFAVDGLALTMVNDLGRAIQGGIDSWEDFGVVAIRVLGDIIREMERAKAAGEGDGIFGLVKDVIGFGGRLLGGGGGDFASLGGIIPIDGATSLPLLAHGGIATRPSIIGEGRFAEAAVPLPDGRSIPVSFTRLPDVAGGAGTTVIIDARGSNGDEAVEAAVMRGIRAAAPQLIEASVETVRDRAARG